MPPSLGRGRVTTTNNNTSFIQKSSHVLSCFILLYFDGSSRKYEASFGLQATACYARWITTAGAYLRLLIFDICHLDDYQKLKLIRLISVYVPSFLLIYLKPSAAEGPRITLFQRDFLLAYHEIDSELADVVLKYFYGYAVGYNGCR